MNKKKPLNIALGLTIALVAVSLLGGNFLSTPTKDNVISTSTISEKLWVMLPLDKHNIKDRSLDGIMIWQLSDIEILKANDEAS